MALFCAWLVASRAEGAPRHALGGALDIGVHVARDDTLVPLAHTGPRLALSPRYFGEFGSGLGLADARVGFAYLRGPEAEEAYSTLWAFHAGLVFFLQHGSGYGLALGPALGWDNETFYFGDWDDSHAYWLGVLWAGPRMHAFSRLSEGWRADLDAQVALLGFYSRPPAYRIRKQELADDFSTLVEWPTHGLEPGWVAEFQVVRASLDFYRSRSDSRVPRGMGLGTEVGFSHASSPDLAVSFETLVRISYLWGL